MSLGEYSGKILEAVGSLSNEYGSGDATSDVALLAFVAAAFTVMLFVLTVFGNKKKSQLPPGYERITSIVGRVEKLEMNVSEFRSEVIRSIEMFKGDAKYLKEDLAAIKRLLSKSEFDEGGDQGGGSAGEGGGDFSIPGESSGNDRKFASEIEEQPETEQEQEPEAAPEEQPRIRFEDEITEEKIPQEASVSSGLKKTRIGFFQKLKNVFVSKTVIDSDMLEELEATLISCDLGVKLVSNLTEELKQEIATSKEVTYDNLIERLKAKIETLLVNEGGNVSGIDPLKLKNSGQTGPLVVMVVGVNGVGKTTTVAKLAHNFKEAGASVMLAAADTFRAAAVNQLKEWGQRVNVPVIAGDANAKPGTVVYDAMVAAKSQKVDVLIIDTAGRLHNKSNLMQELEGVRNIISRHSAEAPHETILVVDGATGQNAISQAKEFNEATPLTGVVVTKLDGTPKGGIVVAIKNEIGIPVRYIGVGESQDALKEFEAGEFVNALFDKNAEAESQNSDQELSAHAEVRRRRRTDLNINLH